MTVDAILLPRKLFEKLRERAEERGSLPEELAAEVIFKSLGEELDPAELVEHYRLLSEKYLAEAKEFWGVKGTSFRLPKSYGALHHWRLRWRRLRGV